MENIDKMTNSYQVTIKNNIKGKQMSRINKSHQRLLGGRRVTIDDGRNVFGVWFEEKPPDVVDSLDGVGMHIRLKMVKSAREQ